MVFSRWVGLGWVASLPNHFIFAPIGAEVKLWHQLKFQKYPRLLKYIFYCRELKYGTPIYDINGNKLGYSKVAAQYGIGQVILSRIAMALPGMGKSLNNAIFLIVAISFVSVITPIVMDYLEKRGTLCRYPWLALPTALGVLGLCLTFATPLACAFFKQKASLPFSRLENEVKVILVYYFA